MSTINQFKAVDLKNFLDGLGNYSTGHTHLTLLQELIDNSLDANANDIIIKTEGNDLIINDNGNGMNIDGLCRCLQFYSKNSDKNTIGKFGIGGSTAIVSLSRRTCNEEIIYEDIIINTIHTSGEQYSINLNWGKYNSITDFEKDINQQLNINQTEQLLPDNYKHGTYIKITNIGEKIKEDYDEDFRYIIKLSQAYKYYLNKNITLSLFDDLIKPININIINICDIININIYKQDNTWGYSSKICRTWLNYKYKKGNNSINSTLTDFDENYSSLGRISIKLTSIDIIDIIQKNIMQEFIDYCNHYEVEDNAEIKTLFDEYINPLHIARKTNTQIRILNSLPINSIHTHIYKELIYEENTSNNLDNKLGIIQQNKSCVNWESIKAKGLEDFIEKIIDLYHKKRVAPTLKNLNKENEFKKSRENCIRLFTMKHMELYNKQEQLREHSSIKIQKWYKTWNYLNKSGLLTLKKCIESYIQYKNIVKIQRWYKIWNNLKKSGLLKLKKCIELYIQSKKITNAIIIQTYYRAYLHKKHINIHKKITKNTKTILSKEFNIYLKNDIDVTYLKRLHARIAECIKDI